MAAFVVAVDRGRYSCLVGAEVAEVPGAATGSKDRKRREPARPVTAMRARELGRKGIVVGDRVGLVGDVSRRPDTLARIVRLEPRTSMLRRSADDTDQMERPIVANADQLVIVTALADPPPRPRLIDRFLVAAYDADLEPLLCLTKADLAAPDDLVRRYEPLGVPSIVVQKGGELDEVRDRLRDRLSVLVGHSGVGKSTLVNALVPDADRAVARERRDGSRPAHLQFGRGARAARRRLDHRHPRACAASGSAMS